MKLLILTCLVVAALARPKFSGSRHPELIQNEPDSREETLKERQFSRFVLPIGRELREEYQNEMNRQRELLREKQEKQSDEIKEHVMGDSVQRESGSSSSSEEVFPSSAEKHIMREDVVNQHYLEQLRRLNKYNQHQLEAIYDQKYIPRENLFFHPQLQQFRRMSEYNHIQLPFQQFYQLDTYPYAVWYYPPQFMQPIAYQPFYDITKPTVSENIEKTDIASEW
ncbi:alpha-S1-casein isoform X2 [Manis javanica]|uniref:alpha-S1-casein isoform X2 n=1 Tax=Manis javanica TaxID=9974 RepID=UPI003C6D0A5A